MKHLSALLLLAFVCTASAQTVKTLGYNTTNGHVVYSGTNALTFTNAFTVATNAVATVRTNLGLGTWATLNDGATIRSENLTISDGEQTDYIQFTAGGGVQFYGNRASQFRNALGLGATAQTIFKVMTNDLSITNQTNATTLGDLTFDTAPNARYVVTANPVFEGITSFQFNSTNATIVGQWNLSGTLGFGSTNPLTNEISVGTTADRSLLQVFYVLGGTNAGSVSLTFRSTTATNTNTIKTGSFLRAELMPQ
jgi:hypothetical protein